jgi:hypothetical protein
MVERASTAGAHVALPKRIRIWWDSLGRVERGLIILVGVRLLIALTFMLDLLPLDLRYRWYLHHGGDQDSMMDLARSIIAGHPKPSLSGIGQPLLMIPWILLIEPASGLDFHYFDIVAPLVLINGFLLGGLSVWIIGKTVLYMTRDEAVAWWTAALWAALPLLTYFIFFWHFDPVILRSANVPKVGWLNGLSDAPATLYVMAAAALLARPVWTGDQPGYRHMAAVGLLFGVAILFRVHVAPMVAFLLAYVLLAHGWRRLMAVCAGGLVGYLPQAIYNQIVFRIPITTGYISFSDAENWGGTTNRPLMDILTGLPFHPRHLAELWDTFIGKRPWLILPLALLIAAIVAVTIHLWRRRGWRSVALLVGTPLAYLVPMATAWPFRYDVIRFSIPAMPYLMAFGVYAVVLVRNWMLRELATMPLDAGSG